MIEQARTLLREGTTSILIQSPTGSGKTVLVATMCKTATERKYGSWFNVHRRELVKQSVMTLSDSAGMDVGVVAAGFPSNRHLLCQVCSIGTLRGRRHLLPDPKLIIWDECHHITANSWSQIFESYPNAMHIGLSATPERLDGKGLGKYFKAMITGPSVAWLIQHGYLADYRLFAPPPPKLDGVHTIAGDYNRKELTQAMNASTVTGDVISHYRKHAMGRRMVLFAWSIESSTMLAAKFRDAGIPAAHVDGETDEATRDATIDQFKRGEIRVMTNVDLFGEGFDVPAMEAVAMLRPTQSLALYLQQIGRGLRPYPGKDHCVILDHAGNCRRFGLPDDERTWSLEGRQKNKAQGNGVAIRVCDRCYAVCAAACGACPHCGLVFPLTGRGIEEVEGNLEEVDEIEQRKLQRQAHLQDQASAKTLDDLIKLAQIRGYKNPEKWAHNVFKHRQAKEAAYVARRFASSGAI